ncbi:hypothetical protein PMAYCL1PPCAC_20275, partial [Pristionchus mayeri]
MRYIFLTISVTLGISAYFGSFSFLAGYSTMVTATVASSLLFFFLDFVACLIRVKHVKADEKSLQFAFGHAACNATATVFVLLWPALASETVKSSILCIVVVFSIMILNSVHQGARRFMRFKQDPSPLESPKLATSTTIILVFLIFGMMVRM